MTTSDVQSKPHELEARDGERSDSADPPRLVWAKVTRWAIETTCGKYRIERFVPGAIETNRRPAGPDRYRIFKRAPEWWFEFAPTETDPNIAKQVCEKDLK